MSNKKAMVKYVLIAKAIQDILLESDLKRVKHHIPRDPIGLKPIEIICWCFHRNILEVIEK